MRFWEIPRSGIFINWLPMIIRMGWFHRGGSISKVFPLKNAMESMKGKSIQRAKCTDSPESGAEVDSSSTEDISNNQ
jgi:hypothetical protein